MLFYGYMSSLGELSFAVRSCFPAREVAIRTEYRLQPIVQMYSVPFVLYYSDSPRPVDCSISLPRT